MIDPKIAALATRIGQEIASLGRRIEAVSRSVTQAVTSLSWSAVTGKPDRFAPTLHAQTHHASGTDPVTISESQVTGLTAALAAKVDDGAVTASGLTMEAARLLGRTTAAVGAVEEITVGSGLSLSAGALTATASSANFPQADFSQPIQSISPGNNVAIGATYSSFEFSSGVDGTITGLDATGTSHGRLICISVRPGVAGILTLSHESGSSTAANRFRLNGVNVTLESGDAAFIQYIVDGSGNGRWRIVGISSPGIGGDIRQRLRATVVYAASQDFTLSGMYLLTGLGANQNNLAVNTGVTHFATGSGGGGPYNITGIASASSTGRILKISVRADQTTGVVLVHNSGLSTAGNRFFNHGAANVTILPGEMRAYSYIGTGAAADNGWYQE